MFFFFDQGQPRFSLQQVFNAYGPGSWLEPRFGYIWQDNAGTTPTTSAGQSIGKINDLSGYGNNATQANAANKPTYQLNSGLPYAACDSNDFMTVSLPSINVRRNLLLYSEQYDNAAAWYSVTVPVSQSYWSLDYDNRFRALKLTPPTSFYYPYIRTAINATNGVTYTLSATVKADGYKFFYLATNQANSDATFNLATGTIFSNANGTAKISPIKDGWYKVSVSFTSTATSVRTYDAGVARESDGIWTGWNGNGTSGILITDCQLEVGPVATDYQKITDWTSEQFSSAGSVYFALNTGMSALHNQSIGTSYSAPIQSMDLYGAYIFPNRLPTSIETQLQLYCAKLAGI